MSREQKCAGSKSAKQFTLAIVGAGRLGSALGYALADVGYQVSAVVARRQQHARRVAQLFPHTRPLALAARDLAALPHTDLLLIATPDDQIAATAARLAGLINEQGDARDRGARRTPRVALHTSGALSSEVLAPMRGAGFAIGALHPLVSVSDNVTGAQNLRGTYYCIEGDAAAVRAARKLVRALAGHSLAIKPADKALYHAAAVLASGHTVALYDLATELLARCGIASTDARRALLPLTESTLRNLLSAANAAQSLTGPFARGDAATVRKNLAALRALDDKSALQIYALLGRRSLRLAKIKGAAADALAEIATLLASVPKRARD